MLVISSSAVWTELVLLSAEDEIKVFAAKIYKQTDRIEILFSRSKTTSYCRAGQVEEVISTS